MLSHSIQQLLFVITNGRQEVHARTLTSVCKSGIVTRGYLFRAAVSAIQSALLSCFIVFFIVHVYFLNVIIGANK